MSKSEQAAVYAAYAALEAAAENLYAAADLVGSVVPSLKARMNELCEDVNLAVVEVDTELDEVI